jgi:hypothetical protein
MDIDHPAPAVTRHGQPRSTKFGLGVFLGFVSAILSLASLILIWLGVIPGLIALFGALPAGIASYRLLRAGRPATTLPVDRE